MPAGILAVMVMMALLLGGAGCASSPPDRHVEEIQYENGKLRKFSYLDDMYNKKGDSANFVNAVDMLKHVDPLAIPELQDLPLPGLSKRDARLYTGVIQNKTKYEVSIPSQNSGATLVIPPHSWIEYNAWGQFFDLTAYYDGKPFYCLKIHVHPKTYPFMCKKYDFLAEIVKPEPVEKTAPVPKKRPIKKKKAVEGVEGLG
jgi:hypothetical protein